MKKCPQCQKVYPDNAIYCADCGVEMEFYQPPESKVGKAVIAILKVVCYIILMVGVQNAVASAFVTAVLLADPIFMSSYMSGALDMMALMEKTAVLILENLTMITLVSHLLTILIISLFFTLRKKNPLEETMLRPVKWQLLPVCALYGLALNIFISVTMSLLPIPPEMLQAVDSQYATLFGQTNIIIEILTTAVLTGLVEEIFFRGLAISRLKRGLSRGAAIVISAVIFGLFHGALVAICYATVLGIVFGLLTDRHNSVLPAVICHIFFNATSFFLTTEEPLVIFALYFISIAILIVGSYLLFKKERTEDAPDLQ